MELIDAAGSVGELVSWIGLLLGLPALAIAWLLRLRDGEWLPVDVVVVERGGRPLGRWFAGGDFHERGVTGEERERLGDEGPAWYASRRPWRMELAPHSPAARACAIIGTILAAVGLLGLLVSFLPFVL